MRAVLTLTLLLATTPLAPGADPAEQDVVDWRPAFSPVTASEPFSLVVMLITNDDSFQVVKPPEEEGGKPSATQWCTGLFQHAYRKALATRPDLKDRCFLQFLPAGTPRQLTGGNPRNQPSRAMVAICNGNNQLLSLAVGVPDADDLLTMIEDAQQVQSIVKLNGNNKKKIATDIAERSTKRITRLWRDALNEMLAAMNAGVDDEKDPDKSTKKLIATLGRIAYTFQEVYFTDVKLRFGLTEAADQTRLVVLEQHLEARRPWCESMMPFIAGTDFTDTWQPITEAVWHIAPVAYDASADELLAWWDTQIKNDKVVLALDPPLLMRQQAWPPGNIGSVADQRGLGWRDLQKLLLELPYRTVDTQQLAALVRDRDLPPIDVRLPSRTRYLLFEPKKRAPYVIRQGDIPSKPIGRIKRALKD